MLEMGMPCRSCLRIIFFSSRFATFARFVPIGSGREVRHASMKCDFFSAKEIVGVVQTVKDKKKNSPMLKKGRGFGLFVSAVCRCGRSRVASISVSRGVPELNRQSCRAFELLVE